MKTYMLVIAATLVVLGSQATLAATCAGGEPDIQNPVPNCGVELKSEAASRFQALSDVREGRSSYEGRYGRHVIGDDR